jgi:hypothetical protein
MPDLRKGLLSRPTLVAAVLVMVGAVAIVVALLSGSSSSDEANPVPSRTQAIDPVAPLDPDDVGAPDPNAADPLANRKDPFAFSYGSRARHEVTVRVTSDGPARVGINFRKGRDQLKNFSGSYSVTRTITSRFPVVQVAMQVVPPSSAGSCTVTIDGVRVSRNTVNKSFGVTFCGG